jgi:signal transduction histidine kinase
MDEVGRLANSFNSMVEQLERAINAQRRFVADTAHELRTPLSTILGNVDLLLRYGEDPSRRRSALASIKREGERTTRLAADLLLLAQADAGQNLELRPVDLDEVLVEVYEQAQGLTDGVFPGTVRSDIRTGRSRSHQADASESGR